MRTFFLFHWPRALSISLAISLGFGGASACAGIYFNNFNTDPTGDPNFSIRGNAVWRPTGSYNGSGYISLTDAIGSQQGTIVIPDFDSGFETIGFNVKMKVRIGGGTGRPADGLSVSFADASDTVVGGGTVGEEGTATGLSVNFDTWDNGNGDGPAIDVKVDGVIIGHKRFAGDGSAGPYCAPVERDGTGNPISLETDPAGTPAPGSWVDFEMNLSSCGALTVKFKGLEIFKDVLTGYAATRAHPGRFVIGARTGAATDNHWIDDLIITTDTGDSPPRLASALPAGNPGREVSENSIVQFVIDNRASFFPVAINSITLTLDGIDITTDPNTTMDFSDPTETIITYTPPTPFASGSRHEAVLTFSDTEDPPVSCTARKIFYVMGHVMGPPVVTNTNDSGPGSLRQVIEEACTDAVVTFAPTVAGTITLTSGELVIANNITINGPGAKLLAISGNTNSRVFHIGPQSNVDISGLTITEGSVQAPQAPSAQPGTESRGAGVFSEGSLRLFDCMLTTNKTQGGSGGNGRFDGSNQGLSGGPGGSGKGAAIYSSGSLALTRCTLVGNRALGGDGGRGVDALAGSQGLGGGGGAGEGGAIWNTAITRLENCTLADNRVGGGRGGNPGSDQFDNDARPGTGGNGLGGALHGPFVLESCTITGNAVTRGLGGQGYSLTGAPGAASGGGVNATGASTLHNSIVARNTNSTTSPDINGSVTSLGWNLIGITDGSSGWTTDDFLGNSSFPLDAGLSPCQDNGGPVWTMCPLAGSPARDAGNSGLPTDARGGPRIVDFPNIPNAPGGDGSDIGALEVDSLFGAITIITFYADTNATTSGFSLVRFKSDPGTTYRLQQTSVVTNRVWTNIVGTVMTGNGQNLQAFDFGPLPTARFYRVRAD